MAEKKDNKIEIGALNIDELIAYLSATELVCDFYDNEMKANTGKYDGEEEEAYNTANSMFLKYHKIRENVFKEIENRVSKLC